MGYVTSYTTAFNTTGTPKTASVTVGSGDVLVILGETFVATNTLGTPSGGGLTYTLQQSIVAVSNQNNVYLWTAPSSSSQTFTMSISMAGIANNWGYTVLRFANINSVGASNKGTGIGTGPSVNVTITSADSILVMGDSDFNASGTAATYRTGPGTPTETLHDTSGGGGTFWAAYYPDAGAVGSKTVGMTAPTQNWATVVVELTQTLATPPPKVPMVPRAPLYRASIY